MWLVAALTAQAHVPPTDLIDTVEQRTFTTRRRDPWAVEPVGRAGIVVYTTERGVRVARRYDADLALQWSVPLPEVVRDGPVATLHRDDAAWAVFQHRANAVVTRHDIDDGTGRVWVVPLEHRSRRVVDFETVGDDAWFVLVDGRSGAGGGLRYLDLESGASRTVSLPPKEGGLELQRLTADPVREVVDIAFRSSRRGVYTQHVAVARAGRVVEDLAIDVGGMNLLDVQRQVFADGSQLAVGTYADEPSGHRAQGFYAARVDERGDVLYIATHSFASLGHFFDDLPPARREARQRAAAERLEQGRDLDIDVRFATHDVRSHDGRIVLSGEVYGPRLGTIPRVAVIDVDGGIRAPSVDAIDGYWFTHAVVAAFDPDGSVAWDASLPMRNVGGSRLVPHVRVGLDGDRATLAYADDDTLISRIFDAGRLVEDRAQRSLVSEDRTPLRRWPMVVEPWFDDAWLAYGMQRKRGTGPQFVLERLESRSPERADAPPKAVLRPLH